MPCDVRIYYYPSPCCPANCGEHIMAIVSEASEPSNSIVIDFPTGDDGLENEFNLVGNPPLREGYGKPQFVTLRSDAISFDDFCKEYKNRKDMRGRYNGITTSCASIVNEDVLNVLFQKEAVDTCGQSVMKLICCLAVCGCIFPQLPGPLGIDTPREIFKRCQRLVPRHGIYESTPRSTPMWATFSGPTETKHAPKTEMMPPTESKTPKQ